MVTVKWLGLYGVLLSSVAAIMLVEIPWLFHNLFKEVFPFKYLGAYIRFFCGLAAVALVSCVVPWGLCSILHLDLLQELIINAFISFIIPNVFFFAVYGRNPMFKDSIAQIKRVLLKKSV